jgi:hypothetical protein
MLTRNESRLKKFDKVSTRVDTAALSRLILAPQSRAWGSHLHFTSVLRLIITITAPSLGVF